MTDLPNAFNSFYSRFEVHDFSENISLLRDSLTPDSNIIIEQEHVRNLLKRVSIRTAPGPDLICGRTLRYCADQLCSVLQYIFQMSFECNQIPGMWKSSTVIPIPKTSNPKQLSDFRPVALTSLIMKIFEKILKVLVMSSIEGLDPSQFAYQAGRGVEDAKLFILNHLYKHLEKPQARARLLFADFSSAFNTLQPHLLIERLVSKFEISHQLVSWILDFLTGREQRVSVNGCLSDSVTISTGSPQGCVLSPLLFILYTDECRSRQEDSYLIKFSDDTALLSLLYGPESNHESALTDFISWCDCNFLDLNVSKTKELIINFRRKKEITTERIIHNEKVEIVSSYKYLGTFFDDHLRFDVNTEFIVKRGQQRIHLLRKLNSFSVRPVILCRFYQAFIESLICFSFICWFHCLSVKDRNNLTSIVKSCSKIIGVKQRDLSSFCNQQILRKAECILASPSHAGEFTLLPSGRRYALPMCKTNRFSKSFIPSALRLLNFS